MPTGIPLTVIGGFLGAGKTTLVNHLLATAERRWGVLVNDFGAVNIDAALIAARNGNTLALTNGCLCCSLGEDMGASLAQLAAGGTEHVIIEASGVADPWRLAQLALVEPGFSLEPLVVLVDVLALPGHLAERWVADAVRGQIAAAEILLLTRTDIATAAQCAAAEALLQALSPGAARIAAPQGAIPASLLHFDRPAPRPGRFIADAPPHPFRHWHWQPDAPFDRDKLRAMLAALPPAVLRLKGFCALGPEAAPHLLQYAAGRWAFTPVPGQRPALVAIGTPEMPAAAALEACCRAALLGQPGGQ